MSRHVLVLRMGKRLAGEEVFGENRAGLHGFLLRSRNVKAFSGANEILVRST